MCGSEDKNAVWDEKRRGSPSIRSKVRFGAPLFAVDEICGQPFGGGDGED